MLASIQQAITKNKTKQQAKTGKNMSLFKTYPPSELTLDLLCSMTPRNVLEYIKGMHEDAEEKKKITKENILHFIIEPCKRKDEEIALL